MRENQRDPQVLIRLEQRREECGRLFRTITGGEGAPVAPYEIPGVLDRSSISKWRRGDPTLAILREDVLYESLRQAGHSRADAESIIAHHRSVIEELWPTEDIDYVTAVRRAQMSDTTEDVCETGALTAPECIARLDRWIESQELHIADATVAIAAARRRRTELARNGRIAA